MLQNYLSFMTSTNRYRKQIFYAVLKVNKQTTTNKYNYAIEKLLNELL